jgi:hypothetical protein
LEAVKGLGSRLESLTEADLSKLKEKKHKKCRELPSTLPLIEGKYQLCH